ncbi:hypothetical protein GEM21_05505 [Salmonella enterica]|nr:hypothetical protein [Salmonella enterica]EEO2148468.1 hypothetical protein [Salmonella enterica]EIL8912104.1 hypothetical protein [Salmonella enterica]
MKNKFFVSGFQPVNRYSIISLSVLIALSCGSVNAFAIDNGDHAFDNAVSARNQAKANQAVANHNLANDRNNPARNMEAARAEAATHEAQSRITGSTMKAQALQQQSASLQNAQSQFNAAQQTANKGTTKAAVDAAAHAASLDNYGVKGNPNLTSQYSPDPQKVSYSGVSQRPATITAVSTPTDAGKPATGSINVAASSLNPSTKVTATVEGKTVQTTAGELAKVAPQIQVAIPHVDALIVSQRQGSDHSKGNTRSEHGTGNGGNNAANSNSAHGLGGGNHVGGGAAQSGSRSVGKW